VTHAKARRGVAAERRGRIPDYQPYTAPKTGIGQRRLEECEMVMT
jgi:hypothetical protein